MSTLTIDDILKPPLAGIWSQPGSVLDV